MASDTTTFEVKVYIQEDNGGWVDLSDRLECSGKNKLYSIGSITYSSESKSIGRVFLSSIDNITFDNSDGFWDDPSQWSSLKTTDGDTASFQISSNNNEYRLEKRKVRISIHTLMTDGTINEYNVGIFRVVEVTTSTKSGTAVMKVESQSVSLSKLDAGKVKDGKAWYTNRSIIFLVKKLLEQEYGTPLPESFSFPDRIDIETYDGSREISNYGRPPEWNGSEWLSRGLTTRAIEWAELTNTTPNAQGSRKRLYFGCDAELWEWDPDSDTYTQIDDGSSFSGCKIIYMTSYNSSTSLRSYLYVILANTDYSKTYGTMYIYRYDGSSKTNPFTGSGSYQSFSGHPFHHIIRRGCWVENYDYFNNREQAFTWVGMNSGDHNDPHAGDNLAVPFSQQVKSLNFSDLFFCDIRGWYWLATSMGSYYNSNVQKSYYTVRAPLMDYAITNIEVDDSNNTFNYLSIVIRSVESNTPLYKWEKTKDLSQFDSGPISTLDTKERLLIAISFSGYSAVHAYLRDIVITGPSIGSVKLPISIDTNLNVGSHLYTCYIDAAGHCFSDELFTNTDLGTGFGKSGINNPGNGSEEIDLALSYGQWYNTLYFPESNKLVRGFPSLGTGVEYPHVYLFVTYFGSDGVTSDTLTVEFCYPTSTTTAYYLYPTAMCRVESDYGGLSNYPNNETDFYVASVVPSSNYGIYVKSFIHLFRNSSNGLYQGMVNEYADAGSNTVVVKSIDSYYFNKGDLVKIDTRSHSIVDRNGSTLTIYPALSRSVSKGAVINLIGKLIYSGLNESYVITEMVDAGGLNKKLIVNGFDRHNLFKNMSVIGELSVEDPIEDIVAVNNLFGSSGNNAYAKYTSLYRGLPLRSYGNPIFVTSTDGLLWEVDTTNKQLNYKGSFDEIESNQASRLLVVPASDMTDMDGLSRTEPVVFGVSAPTFPEETQAKKPTGKYYLWKYDKWLTDRVELADFSDMNVWEAITQLVNIAPDYTAGFNLDDEGSFFLSKKDESNYSTIEIHADGTDDNLIYISKNRGLSEIYNRASVTPYMAKMQDPSFEVVLAPRDPTNREETDSSAKADDLKLSVGVNYEIMLKLICVRGGSVTADYDDLESCSLFKYSIVESTIDAILTSDFSSGSAFCIVDSLFRGGTPITREDGTNWILPDAINVGDYATFVNPDTQEEITLKITNIDIDTNKITFASAIGFTLKAGTTFTVSHHLNTGDNTTTSTWSSEGVTTVTASGTGTTIPVASVRDLSKYTVVKIGTSYTRITSIDEYDDVLSSMGNAVSSITVTDSIPYSSGDIVQAYWSPCKAMDGTSYDYQEIGGSGIYMAVSPSSNNQITFKEFDRITITSKGLALEEAKHSTQIAYDSTSESRYGTLEFSNITNKFIRRSIAKHYVRKIIKDYKDPHYVLTIESSLLPNARFTDANGLLRFAIYSKKMFPKKLKVLAYPRKITHNFKTGTTTIIARDIEKY